MPPLHGVPVPARLFLHDQLQGIGRISQIGSRVIRSYPLVDIDEINLPSMVKPYAQMSVNGYAIATDLFSFLTQVPFSDCVVFNQVVQIPEQRKLLRKLQGKAKRHGSMPDPSNKIAKADIEEVLDRLAVDSTLLVYSNFNMLVSCPADKVTPVTSYLETKLYECGIIPSKARTTNWNFSRTAFPAMPTLSIPTMTFPDTLGCGIVLLLQGASERFGRDSVDHVLHRPSGTAGMY